MKKGIFFVIVFTISVLYGLDVTGQQSGTWTLNESPYNVISDITVPTGSVLTIEPGVQVHIDGLYQITVQGNIIAEGTEADSIRFLSTSRWKGFRLENTEVQSRFLHCFIEKTQNGIHSIYSPCIIKQSRVNDATENCLNLSGIGGPSAMLVKQCKLSGAVKSGVMITQNSNVVVDSCEIYSNGSGTQYYGAIQLQNQSSTVTSNPMISNNWVHHNLKQGLTAWDYTGNSMINPTIINNTFENNLTGIYLREASGLIKNNIVRNNFITGNANSGAGIMIARPSAHPIVTENIVMGNYTGFYIGEGAVPNLGNVINSIPGDDGMNTIVNNIDGNGVPHSIVIYLATGNLTADVMAQNNIWGTTDLNEIDVSITDQSDNSLMGTVTYLPLYITPNISGTISYEGTENFQQLILMFYDLVQENITYQQVLSGVGPYQVTAPVGTYYVQAIGGNIVNDELDPVVFGTYGGTLNPMILNVEANQVYDNIDIEMLPYNDHTTIKLLTPYSWDDKTVFPLAIISPFGLEEAILVYEENDYIYQAGDMHLNVDTGQWEPDYYPSSVVLLKNHNYEAGDYWESDSLGFGIINGLLPENITTPAGDYLPYRVSTYQNGTADSCLINRRYYVPDTGLVLIREFENGQLIYEQKLVSSIINGGTGLMPLSENNQWIMRSFIGENKPSLFNISYDSLQVRQFCWDAPTGTEWLGYKLYRNNVIFTELPFLTSSYPVPEDYETYDWYVKAFNLQGESESSNVIQHTGNNIPIIVQSSVRIKHYPNPIRNNTKSMVSFNLSLPEETSIDLSVYNIKGQKVVTISREHLVRGDHKILWNGLNKNQKQLASGVYFYRLKTKQQTITRKMLIIK